MLKKIALMLALPLALVMSTLAVAQSNPPTPPPFAALGGQTAISASNASSRVALPASTSAFGAITVYNASTTVDAYVALGDVTVVALNSGGVCAAPTFTMCLVKAGTSIVIWASGNTYIAGITSSSTASLVIYQGSGGVQLSAIYSGTSPPSGPAGGDLSGTYPNPTVVGASSNGAASFSPLILSGTILTGGTGTTNFPAIFMQPTGTTAATTWSTTGTGIGMNLASGFAGNFLDFRTNGGNSKFSVDNSGNTKAATITLSSNRLVFVAGSSQNQTAWLTNGVQLAVGAYTWTDTSSAGTVAAQYVNAFKAPTVAASSATVYTNSYNTYFENPVAGTNVTQTNAWALGADSLFDAGKLGLASGSIVAWNADTGLSRDSVLGAGNLDLGNGTANDKTGTLNAAKVALGGCTIGTNNLCVTGTTLFTGAISQTGGSVTIGSSAVLSWNGRSALTSAVDGNILLQNNAQTDFTLLQLGGTTSSFPAIKRSTNTISFRLADDSNNASIVANALVHSGGLIAGGSAPTGSGTCTRGAQTGGNTTGTIVLTCTAQTLILTFTTTAPTGWMCEAIDQTTTADTMKQTSNTTTSCTLTGTTAASDVVLFQARAY